MLLVRRFKRHFLARIALLVLGSFILPLGYLVYFLTHAEAVPLEFLVFAAVSFLIALAGEFLGRYLFFVTVVPKNMPGSFFTASGKSH